MLFRRMLGRLSEKASDERTPVIDDVVRAWFRLRVLEARREMPVTLAASQDQKGLTRAKKQKECKDSDA